MGGGHGSGCGGSRLGKEGLTIVMTIVYDGDLSC